MEIGNLSLIFLVFCIFFSLLFKFNPGYLALLFGLILTVIKMPTHVTDFINLVPVTFLSKIFLVCWLFSIFHQRKTLQTILDLFFYKTKISKALTPWLFFILSVLFSALGPGNIIATALLAPLAMAAANRFGISAFLMAIAVCHGANAGVFSALAPVGLLINHQIVKDGFDSILIYKIFFWNLLIQLILVGLVYISFIFKKYKINDTMEFSHLTPPKGFRSDLLAIVIFIICTLLLKLNLEISSAIGLLIVLMQTRSFKFHTLALKNLPWNTFIMLTGMMFLANTVERSGGTDVLVNLLVKLTPSGFGLAAITFLSGVSSVYSSSIGVVLPTYLPLIKELSLRLNESPQAMITSLAVGSHLVDVSPLSTLGALSLAAAQAAGRDIPKLYHYMMIWGLSMTVVGALLSQLLF